MEPSDPAKARSAVMAQDLDARLIELSLSLFGGGGRRSYPGDEILVHEGDDPGGIWLILKGRVELFRSIGGEDVIFHFESAGRLVGLLSLAGRQPSLFSCRAKGPVEALFITHDEIRRGLQESTEFGTWLLRVMVHSLGRRNRRSAELLVEVHVLNQRLEAQRDELQAALEHLQRAQLQIIESEKMATLGNLSAGMAHELNNPVAAILRATEFIAKDLSALLAETPGLATAAAALPLAMRQQPMSTSEERETKARLAASLGGDRALASRLFSSGIRTTGDLEALLDPPSPEPRAERLRQIERGGQLGASLRSLDHCSRRIADLVRSLKLYARDDDDRIEGIDLNQTLEDTLLLLSGKLQGIEVEKHYDRLPPVAGHPSRLQQVWVNLIVNAAQALPGKGRIVLRTRLRPDGWIEVAIEDNGHGIPEEVQSRLFEHRFTTRGGRVEFGLGFGLPICRMIVENHGGRLSFESVPGHTVFRVALPADPAFPSTPPTPA